MMPHLYHLSAKPLWTFDIFIWSTLENVCICGLILFKQQTKNASLTFCNNKNHLFIVNIPFSTLTVYLYFFVNSKLVLQSILCYRAVKIDTSINLYETTLFYCIIFRILTVFVWNNQKPTFISLIARWKRAHWGETSGGLFKSIYRMY